MDTTEGKELSKDGMAGKSKETAASFVPENATLRQLAHALQSCTGCDLYRHATQAVGGEGPGTARIVMVGEQPGDKEDLAGKPFVGPAGKLLDEALADAGIKRSDVYVSNAVKHFKFEERGRRRIHKKPAAAEIDACYPWLAAELSVIHPAIIVCLGATAARSVIGRKHQLLKERGKFFEHAMADAVMATVHPSAILRSPDAAQRRKEYEALVADLAAVARRLKS
jgi:uracil-DNA glycosylase family protein